MKNDGFQRINAPAHHELNRCYTHEINELNGVHTISSQMIIQHCKYVDDMILNEIRKVMIEENIPEMYIFNDSWIIEAFREKMERERETMKHLYAEPSELRNNLLVTMGARAAYMECLGLIELPRGVDGEKELSDFVTEKVDIYMAERLVTYDMNFDQYMEEVLLNKYGPKHARANGKSMYSVIKTMEALHDCKTTD